MRSPEQVAVAAIENVKKKMALTGDIGSFVWQTAIAEEVTAYQREYSAVVGKAILKVKSIKARQREALAAELDAALKAQ